MTTAPVGLVLYGPPAVGKSTITDALTALDTRFELFPVIKAGSGRTAGYTMASGAGFAEREASGDFVFSWERYGSRYAVSASALVRFTNERIVPVVHLGSVAAVRAVTAVPPFRWTVVQLWVSREVCAERVRRRGTDDFADRVAAYDQTAKLGPDLTHLTLDTDTIGVDQAVRAIRSAVLEPGAHSSRCAGAWPCRSRHRT